MTLGLVAPVATQVSVHDRAVEDEGFLVLTRQVRKGVPLFVTVDAGVWAPGLQHT